MVVLFLRQHLGVLYSVLHYCTYSFILINYPIPESVSSVKS
jgi:hypothetical protein